MKSGIAAAVIVCSMSLSNAAAQTLEVQLNESAQVRVETPVSVIVVGNPIIADVAVETPNLLSLTGRAPGKTNLIIFDKLGEPVADFDLVIVDEKSRLHADDRDADLIAAFD